LAAAGEPVVVEAAHGGQQRVALSLLARDERLAGPPRQLAMDGEL